MSDEEPLVETHVAVAAETDSLYSDVLSRSVVRSGAHTATERGINR
jgi:hypothetical protein